jgi:hypothetical protein
MHITIGSPVTQDDFFNREEILQNVWDTLETDNVLLAAPRRVGKSSLMLKLLLEPKAGFEALWLDGQNYDAPEDLVADLAVKAAKLRGSVTTFFGRLLSGITENIEQLEVWELKVKLRERLSGSWRAQGETMIRDAIRPDMKLLIVIDELPMLLHKLIRDGTEAGRKAADGLLDWLRHIRQEPEFLGSVRQILGGSIGLPRIASILGSSHRINDLRSIPVGPFERPKAKELATQLLNSRGVAIEDHVMEAMLDRIGTLYPIFIQIMAAVVASEVRRWNKPADPDLIRECYEQRALGLEFRLYFEDYYERLSRYYSPEEAGIARIMLRALAITKDPLSKSSLLGLYQRELGQAADALKFDLLLTWLSDDFYVEETGDGCVRFKSTWMRDWWRTYHGSRP